MKRINLIYGYFENRTYYCTHNAGFFSCCSICLGDIIRLYKLYKLLPEKIDFSNSLNFFKTKEQLKNKENIYLNLFKLDSNINKKISFKDSPNYYYNTNVIYYNYHLKDIQKLIKMYFIPNDEIIEIQRKLIKKYEIDLSKTICVLYRGTDKWKEVRTSHYLEYLKETKNVLKKNPDFKIWIQTDELRVRDFFKQTFKDKCFYIKELPVTSQNKVMHMHDEKELKMNKFEFGKLFLAVINLLSKSHTLITHTGNCGFWAALYRGNTKNLRQDIDFAFDPWIRSGHIPNNHLRFQKWSWYLNPRLSFRFLLLRNKREIFRRIFKRKVK